MLTNPFLANSLMGKSQIQKVNFNVPGFHGKTWKHERLKACAPMSTTGLCVRSHDDQERRRKTMRACMPPNLTSQARLLNHSKRQLCHGNQKENRRSKFLPASIKKKARMHSMLVRILNHARRGLNATAPRRSKEEARFSSPLHNTGEDAHTNKLGRL